MNIKMYAIRDKFTKQFLSKSGCWINDYYKPRLFDQLSHVKNHFRFHDDINECEIVTFEIKETGEVIDGSSL